ncbi:MAG: BREX-1 system phosphatase PglZ type A [Dissulfuribacterales bacterium]
MNTKQISETLNQIFSEKNKRIIFWYDGEKEFDEILSSITIPDAELLRMDEHGALELKIKLESDNPKDKFILYAPWYEPPPEDDWLFDIRLYSHTFHADSASVILKELNLENQSLHPYIKQRQAFFRSQDRVNRLKKWIQPNDAEDDIDLKMLAVITRADLAEPFSILMKLFDSFCGDGDFIVSGQSKIWTEIEKFELTSFFRKLLSRTFGYVNEDSTGLTDFLIRIFVTDFSNNIKADLPASLSHFIIQNSSLSMNASVFLSQWRSNTGHFKNYNIISQFIGKRLKTDDLLVSYDIESLLEVVTFAAVERRIISAMRDQIIKINRNGFQEIQEVIKVRLDGYWATTVLDDPDQANLYKTVYHALENAILLFDLRKKYDAGFSYPSAKDMFSSYVNELFLFDQYYRIFHELADKADFGGWDILKSLRETVEDCYSGWFMEQLCLKWGDFLESRHVDNLFEKWRLPGISNQYDFFDSYIQPTLKESKRNRLFVIVSDAFRFEAAEELIRVINGKYRLKADIEPMLGVLPSYTSLGMACLLPHKTISFKDTANADILIDGKSVGSLDQRAAALSHYEGTAIKADDLLSMSKDKGREFVKPHRIIYIYHDLIDAVGDKAVSESNTFDAVRKTINELYALVSFIINSLNGTRVIITADHGFIYQEKAPTPIDKSNLEIDLKDTAKTHKRFVMGKNLGTSVEAFSGKAFSGNTSVTAHTETGMEFLLAKGTNRFNFVGGARFFHGGAMLQEIVLPVVTVTEMKGKHLEKSEVRHVGVSLLGTIRKLVTNRPIYKFIQTEPVSDRMKPVSLKISLRDGNDLISNEETITFDSTSSSLDDRQKTVKLALKNDSYDNKKEYHLVLRNLDDTEHDRIPVIIDIAFANDF